MGRKRSDLELLMRRLGELMGFGFQFRRFKNEKGRYLSKTGLGAAQGNTQRLFCSWELNVWDTRPGKWRYRPGCEPHRQDFPLTYSSKVVSDAEFTLDSETAAESKDDFICEILFSGRLFDALHREFGMPLTAEEAVFASAVKNRDRTSVLVELKELERKYGGHV